MEIAMYVVWPIIAIIAIVVELNTQAQIGWAISIASIVAIIPHGVTKGDPAWIEFTTFALVWAVLWILLYLFRGKLRKRLHDKEDGFLAYINKSYVATKSNDDKYGQIEINDKIFRFKSNDKINVGDEVIVKSIKGVTFHVEKLKESKK